MYERQKRKLQYSLTVLERRSKTDITLKGDRASMNSAELQLAVRVSTVNSVEQRSCLRVYTFLAGALNVYFIHVHVGLP